MPTVQLVTLALVLIILFAGRIFARKRNYANATTPVDVEARDAALGKLEKAVGLLMIIAIAAVPLFAVEAVLTWSDPGKTAGYFLGLTGASAVFAFYLWQFKHQLANRGRPEP